MTVMVGSTLSERYELIEKLGEGGMAIVYRGRDKLLGRHVAVKVLRGQYAADTDFVERFRREAQAAASFSHPNVVHIFDVGTADNVHYIVMEYVAGKNLKEIIRQQGALSFSKTLHIAKGVCRALEAAHKQELIHRDIKPHNILVTDDCHVKVTDFGIARAASTATLTHTGTVIGSVHYLSPEQATGQSVGVFSDVYSVGILLFEMLTGTVPFDGESPVAIALKHLQADPPSPREHVPNIPASLEKVTLRAIAKDPTDRYETMSDMLLDLQRAANELRATEQSDVVVDTHEPKAEDEDDDETVVGIPLPNIQSPQSEKNTSSPASTTDNESETTIVRVPTRRAQASSGEAKEETTPMSDEKQPQKRKRRVWIWLILLLSFASGMVWAGTTLYASLFPAEVTVPEIVGMSVDDARRALGEYNLSLRVTRELNSDQPVNTVLRQTPQAQRTVRMGRTIDVHVSVGQEVVEVPDLTALSPREAELRLRQNGLELGERSEQFRPDVVPNVVVAQEPPPQERAVRGSSVDLVFSTGAPPVSTVSVPEFIGMQLDDAIADVEELGLVVGETFAEADNRFQPGEVTDQLPASGTELEVGSVVGFVYNPQEEDDEQDLQVIPADPLAGENEGDDWVQALISITVPPGPRQEIEIVIIDNISARRVYHEFHSGNTRISEIIKGRGQESMYQVWIDGKLVNQDFIRKAK